MIKIWEIFSVFNFFSKRNIHINDIGFEWMSVRMYVICKWVWISDWDENWYGKKKKHD